MNIGVIIEPHERHEALEAYRDWLTPEQVAEIENAPEGSLIMLQRVDRKTNVQVIEEG